MAVEPCYLIHYQIVLHSSEPRATSDKMKFCKLMVQDNGVGTLLFNREVVSWCCGSPNDVTFRPFCVSHYHKVQVFIQPLQILISANECKMSVGLSVPTNSLTNFDLIKQEFN